MQLRSEAEAQGFITRAFRKPEFLVAIGLWEFGAACVEAKCVACNGKCRKKQTGGREGICGTRLAFSKIEEGQRTACRRAKGEGVPLVHKISDSGIGYKPVDMVAMWRVWAGFCFVWSCEEVCRAYLVETDAMEAFIEARKGRGSISEEEAGEIGKRFEIER